MKTSIKVFKNLLIQGFGYMILFVLIVVGTVFGGNIFQIGLENFQYNILVGVLQLILGFTIIYVCIMLSFSYHLFIPTKRITIWLKKFTF